MAVPERHRARETPTVTLKTYAHVVEANAREAARAIGRGLHQYAPWLPTWLMVWVASLGMVLELLGLVLATRGIALVYSKTFQRSVCADLWSDITRWFRETVLRKRPPPTTVHGSMAGSFAFAGSAFAQVRPGAPPTEASPEEQIDYLMRAVDALSDEGTRTREHAQAKAQEAEQRVGKRIDRLSERLDETGRELGTVHTALFGVNGSGLRETVSGLTITAVGVLLSLAGL